MEKLTASEQIRLICKRKGITLARLAELTEQSPSNLQHKITADNWRINDLEKIAAALGCSLVVELREE